MKKRLLGAASAALSLAACGSEGTPQSSQSPAADLASHDANDDAKTHSADGTVEKVAVDQVTIAHGPVQTLQWPEMTMAFSAQDAALLKDIRVGDRVAFSFTPSGGAYALTAISKK